MIWYDMIWYDIMIWMNYKISTALMRNIDNLVFYAATTEIEHKFSYHWQSYILIILTFIANYSVHKENLSIALDLSLFSDKSHVREACPQGSTVLQGRNSVL